MSATPHSTLARLDRRERRVLVADDSATYRAVAARVLGDAGYQVSVAADGAQALEMLQGEPSYHVLVAELNLPRVRGLDLLRRVRESPRLAALRVLMVTEVLSEHLRRVLADLALDASLTKNHALRELLWQVDALAFPQAGELRASPRRLLRLPVNYWVGDRLCLQSCFDLSETGMFVAVADEEPPPVGTRIALRFWLPTSDRLLACQGDVAWVNASEGDLRMSHPPGMGIAFSDLGEADRALIASHLERSQP